MFRTSRILLITAPLLLGAAPAPSPVHDRLMEWLELAGPAGVNLPAERYHSFLVQTPQWPSRARMMWRYQNALAKTTDDAELSELCPSLPLSNVQAFLVCASHLKDPGEQARRIWISSANSPADEQDLLSLFGQSFTPADQWTRYERQEATGQYAAARRQILRLQPDQQPVANARLSQKTSSPDADTLFDDLSTEQQTDAKLIQYRIHALRRAGRLDDALALWDGAGQPFQARTPSHAWALERNALARALLLAGRGADAYTIADDQTSPANSPDRQNAAFLSGFIALRVQNDPAKALPAFQQLTDATSLTVRARGFYWSGRAHEALGHGKNAHIAYETAAGFPTTFYGQLALAALSQAQDLLTRHSSIPEFTQALQRNLSTMPVPAAGEIARQDLVDAAIELAGMGDIRNARLFLMALQMASAMPSEQRAVADLSVQLGVAEPDVFAARALARKGVALYPEGFPLTYVGNQNPNLPEGLVPAVVRQESSFDPYALSPANAVGLLQLLPGAARDVVRHAGLKKLNVTPSGLENPETNITVGSAYLSQLLTRFDGVLPYALAAYNAGPHRVDQWILANPPASLAQDDLIDWIERVPYLETRIYIQNILANMQIYRTLEQHDQSG
ncbi:lytic transglycosylase domain-containing protein [Gluconobacter wancherniae]|uniref:lytic transglycosylase domain-containing protein n=1 Tax=Gluconobacter wancherniae TaxID=1307955 RepID=UPI001B8B1EC6|nr:lytic transglycosylase domain-containing protein [Gluconobacter wancherniae]MBS1088248.1 lytic transglycosylase domain-containing protein [Gluconobacter wancherniae]